MSYLDKALPTTKAIRNAGIVQNMYIIVKNKISSRMKVWCFQNPHSV